MGVCTRIRGLPHTPPRPPPQVKPDCSNFDEESAWPIIIDDYVAFLQKSKESKEKAT